MCSDSFGKIFHFDKTVQTHVLLLYTFAVVYFHSPVYICHFYPIKVNSRNDSLNSDGQENEQSPLTSTQCT
jgi:hypothetical protein